MVGNIACQEQAMRIMNWILCTFLLPVVCHFVDQVMVNIHVGLVFGMKSLNTLSIVLLLVACAY